ncbi:PREDICTED: meiotic recombination protein REC8 homolog [Gekko japonicus]|uniref:Meiotic recombination protein REC8 homolog n=1 Tax=Gekko japonicus TaxID=146911 RepID=A0ABM1KEK9_GEKJA|nr:PREDICTED: meiotic recombination protein REC8 homolog [Gekko japonicus]
MFYYPNVLQRHTGCFATIWLAATGATRLLKREYLKVNIPQTCEEIIAFILVQVPPIIPGSPRPRFSLYLSAQLQYGVVRVYNRQCQYLAEEIQQILERLNRVQQQIRIDLTDLEQPMLLPDQLTLMETLEEAPDPFFGVMVPALPSPAYIPHVRGILEAPTPEKSPPERSPQPPTPHRRLHIAISPDDITLKEAEPITLLQIEGEQDLPEITVREIDMLVEQERFVVHGDERPPPRPTVSPRKRRAEEESMEKVRKREPSVFLGLSPPARTEEEPLAARETGVLSEEETRPLMEAPLVPLEITPPKPGLVPSPRSPLVSPKRQPPLSPELRLPAYEPSPARPSRRRRQLRFVDEVTQISREDFQKQILDSRTQCQPLEAVLLPAKRLRTPAELLGAPTHGWMHPTLRGLWTHCANLQHVDYARRRAREEEEQRREEEEQRPTEVPSEVEVLREAEEPSVRTLAGSSEISLESSEEELRSSLVAAEERILVEPEEVMLPVVPELPEISFELPLDKDMLTLTDVRRLVAAKLQQFGETEFEQLVPSTTSRAVASRFFYMCLVLAGSHYFRLEQAEPFGRILIKPGTRFHPS